jgi:D-glycero-D-manno-heptose 1,7-bisphosphate phosphatase
MEKLNKAVFLDRDGVINRNSGYVFQITKFIWLKNVKKAIKLLNKENYKIFVITNQSGVARGFFSEKDVENLHNWMNLELNKINAKIDDFFYCPFHPKVGLKKYKRVSIFRKPSPGMVLKAIRMYKIDVNQSFMIGDKKTDEICAKKSKIKFYYKKNNLLKDVKIILKKSIVVKK